MKERAWKSRLHVHVYTMYIVHVRVHAFKVEHWPGNQVVMGSSPVQDKCLYTSHVHVLVCTELASCVYSVILIHG